MRIGRLTIAVGLVAVLLGCGSSSEPSVSTYLFFGTATSTTVEASGAWVYLRLVGPDGLIDDAPLYVTRCQLSGPSCEFQINQVAEGRYTVFGLVDLDGDAARADPLPSAGDLFSPARPLTMLSRQQMDFPDNAWHILP